MAGPDVSEGSKVVQTPVSLVDCFPTALECVGAERVDEDLPGRSLWQIAQEDDRERTVFSEYHALGTEHGSRGPLTITLLLQAAMAPAWLFLPTGLPWIALWAGGVYLLWGALDGGHQMGQSRAMIDAVSKEHQAEGFSLAMYASALGGITTCASKATQRGLTRPLSRPAPKGAI